MAAPRTQLLRLPRAAFQSTPAARSSFNALNKSLPSLFARCITTETTSAPDAFAGLPPSPPPAAAENSDSTTTHPESKEAQAGEYKWWFNKKVIDRRLNRQFPRPIKEPVQLTTATNVKISRKYGRVISAGRMDKTVRVEYTHTVYDKHIRRPFPAKTRLMVADPNNSCREGDVIQFGNGWRTSKNVHHVVEKIVAPFGSRIEDRPPVTSRMELEQEKAKKLQGEDGVRVGKTKAKVLRRMEAEKERLAKVAEAEARKAKLEAIEQRRRMQAAEEEERAKSEYGSEKWQKEELAIMEKALKSMNRK